MGDNKEKPANRIDDDKELFKFSRLHSEPEVRGEIHFFFSSLFLLRFLSKQPLESDHLSSHPPSTFYHNYSLQ